MNVLAEYQEFLAGKTPAAPPSGMATVPDLPDCLKPFQAAIVGWGLRRGKAAFFEGTGLGKTLQQLSWARAVCDHDNGRALILTPLAVAQQTVAEAAKWGIDSVSYAPDGASAETDIVVTNYERFEKFDISRFTAIVLDESGLIKNKDGATRKMLTEACIDVPWKLCCTATPAPNDYTELGQHAEFLGVMSAKEMLAMFFVHDGSIRANDATQATDGWRLKRHAERDFWRWLASWSVMVRHPSDLGFDGVEYDLPPLTIEQVTVAVPYEPTDGKLFPMEARTLSERIGARRASVDLRVQAAVEIIKNVWNDLPVHDIVAECGNRNTQQPAAKNTPPTKASGNGARTKLGRKRRIEPTCASIILPTRPVGTGELLSNASVSTIPDGQNTQPTQNSVNVSGPPRETAIKPASATDESLRNSELPLNGLLNFSVNKGTAAPSVANPMLTNQGADYPLTTATRQGRSEDFFALTVTAAWGTIGTVRHISDLPQIISNDPDDASWVVWCNLNSEQDDIAKALGNSAYSVYGALPHDDKVSRIFGWIRGERRVLVSKPSICGHGLNFQRCHNMIFVGLTDSFEQVYQAIRRCWRFGQLRPVKVYFVASELEGAVVANLRRKEEAFNAMLDAMSGHMRDLMREQIIGGRVASAKYNPTVRMELPGWISDDINSEWTGS